MNEWRGRGGLTRDLGIEDVNGMTKVWFSLAVNGTRYDSQKRETVVKTTYVSCEAWGPVAERLIAEAIGKGCELMVIGELTQFKKQGEEESHTRIAVFDYSVTRVTRQHQQGGGAPAGAPAASGWATGPQTPPAAPAAPWGGGA